MPKRYCYMSEMHRCCEGNLCSQCKSFHIRNFQWRILVEWCVIAIQNHFYHHLQYYEQYHHSITWFSMFWFITWMSIVRCEWLWWIFDCFEFSNIQIQVESRRFCCVYVNSISNAFLKYFGLLLGICLWRWRPFESIVVCLWSKQLKSASSHNYSKCTQFNCVLFSNKIPQNTNIQMKLVQCAWQNHSPFM